jgi:hypothetical protein
MVKLVTGFILTKSSIWIAIKPWRCDWRYILLEVETVDNQPTLCKGPFQSIPIGWSLLTWWCRCKRDLQQSFVKNSLYPNYLCHTFKKFYKFCGKSKSIFLHLPSEGPRLVPTRMVGFDWNWWTHICTHHLSHFGASVFYIIVWIGLEFIFIFP